MFEDIFRRRKMVPERLTAYGFAYENGVFSYKTVILQNEFLLEVCIDKNGCIDTKVIEKSTAEEYVLYKTGARGAFVGDVRMAIASVLEEIAAQCFEVAVFKQEQTLQVIEHVAASYGDNLEFLWKKSPDNAVWRRKDTQKWYGAVLKVAKSKLGLDSQEIVEIIDLRVPPEEMEALIRREGFYPGWHMNKKNWCTVILDGSVADEEVYERIRVSYELAVK